MKKSRKNGMNTARKCSQEVKPLTDEQRSLVEKHYSLAMNMGKRFAGLGETKGLSREDLQQEACYGLCMAAQRYDERKGTEFQTYAYDWCYKFIMLAIEGERGTADLDVERMKEACIYDEDEDEAERAEKRAMKAERLLTLLNSQERKVVCMIFGIGSVTHDFKEVAQKLHLQTERIHHIYESALTKMEVFG